MSFSSRCLFILANLFLCLSVRRPNGVWLRCLIMWSKARISYIHMIIDVNKYGRKVRRIFSISSRRNITEVTVMFLNVYSAFSWLTTNIFMTATNEQDWNRFEALVVLKATSFSWIIFAVFSSYRIAVESTRWHKSQKQFHVGKDGKGRLVTYSAYEHANVYCDWGWSNIEEFNVQSRSLRLFKPQKINIHRSNVFEAILTFGNSRNLIQINMNWFGEISTITLLVLSDQKILNRAISSNGFFSSHSTSD